MVWAPDLRNYLKWSVRLILRLGDSRGRRCGLRRGGCAGQAAVDQGEGDVDIEDPEIEGGF